MKFNQTAIFVFDLKFYRENFIRRKNCVFGKSQPRSTNALIKPFRQVITYIGVVINGRLISALITEITKLQENLGAILYNKLSLGLV